jgi:hypothetical protein
MHPFLDTALGMLQVLHTTRTRLLVNAIADTCNEILSITQKERLTLLLEGYWLRRPSNRRPMETLMSPSYCPAVALERTDASVRRKPSICLVSSEMEDIMVVVVILSRSWRASCVVGVWKMMHKLLSLQYFDRLQCVVYRERCYGGQLPSHRRVDSLGAYRWIQNSSNRPSCRRKPHAHCTRGEKVSQVSREIHDDTLAITH